MDAGNEAMIAEIFLENSRGVFGYNIVTRSTEMPKLEVWLFIIRSISNIATG
jgi:hypothetical protein